MSHSLLKTDSLSLEPTGTAVSAAALSTAREENINYMLDLSDDEVGVIAIALHCNEDSICFYVKNYSFIDSRAQNWVTKEDIAKDFC